MTCQAEHIKNITCYHRIPLLFCINLTGTGSSKAQFLKPSEAQKAASLLGTSVEELSRNIFSSRTSGTPTRGGRLAVAGMEMSGGDPNAGAVESLEGMAVGLYAELVNAVVSLINR